MRKMVNGTNKMVSIILAFCMLIALFPVSAKATFQGSGTMSQPYLISSEDDLTALSDSTDAGMLGAYYQLQKDIVLSNGTWKPIGLSNAFSGVFDGNGHTISGINSFNSTSYGGIFALNSGTIKNLGVEISASGVPVQTGALVGYNSGTVQNCFSEGTIIDNNTSKTTIGGLVGINTSVITDCHSSVDISRMSAANNFELVYGGLVGSNRRGGSITDSYAVGDVEANWSGDYSYRPSVGGLIGACSDNSEISDCHASGNVNCSGAYAGGLVGLCDCEEDQAGVDIYIKIRRCYATGNTVGNTAGGLVGYNLSYCYRDNSKTLCLIQDCYARGNVTGTFAGGLAGYNRAMYYGASPTSEAIVSRCYSTGSVTGSSSGGLVGKNSKYGESYHMNGTIEASYYDSLTSGLSDTDRGSPVNTTAMKLQSNYIGWDFTNTWEINETNNDGYPTLRTTSSGTSQTDTPANPNEHNLQGEGTSTSPFHISSEADLKALASFTDLALLRAYYQLQNDIILTNGTWTPIGLISTFDGVFDGNGHTVSGLKSFTSSERGGLFASNGGTIKNLNVTISATTATKQVGAVVALNFGTVQNCRSEGSIIDSNSAHANIGGLVGKNTASGTVTGCRSDVNISRTNTVSFSYSFGGLIGHNTGTVSGSIATGNVDAKWNGSYENGCSVGGLIGTCSDNAEIYDCCATGTVSGNGYYAGGLIGLCDCEEDKVGADLSITIRRCFATGNVSGSTVGGLVGYNLSFCHRDNSTSLCIIEDCYARGDVTGNGSRQAGGLVGNNRALYWGASDNPTAMIRRCYSTGLVTGNTIGGLVGANSVDDGRWHKDGLIVDCYYDSFYGTYTAGQYDTDHGNPLDTVSMKSQDSYSGWNFSDTWKIDSTENDGYPTLRTISIPLDAGNQSASSSVPAPCTLEQLTDLDFLAFADLADKKPTVPVGTTIKGILEANDNQWDKMWSESENIKYSELYNHIQSWKYRTYKEDESTGFFAAAYVNNDGEAVITYRGSVALWQVDVNPFDGEYSQWWNDWVKNDGKMFLNHEGEQLMQAIEFYDSLNKDFPSSKIAVAGHSLGGGLADIVSAYSGSYERSFSSAPFLDVAYAYHPERMAKAYEGADRWNFLAHVNNSDPIGGVYSERKHRVAHPHVLDMGFFDAHGMQSYARKNESGELELTPGVSYPTGSTVMYWNDFSFSLSLSNVIAGLITNPASLLTMGTSRDDTIQGTMLCRWTCYGGNGKDLIYSKQYADTIIGGKGNDQIHSVFGDDVYYYCKGDGCDYIYDEGGHDTIRLIGFDDSDSITAERSDNGLITISNQSVPIMNISSSHGWISSFKIEMIENNEVAREYDISDLFDETNYSKHYDISCPVDVQIIDTATGEVVYTVYDGVPGITKNEYGTFVVYEEENGEYGKSISLVDGYSVKVIGKQEGTMNIVVSSISNGAIETSFETSCDTVSEVMVATILENDDGTKNLAVDNDGDGETDESIPFAEVYTVAWLNGDGTVLDERSYRDGENEPVTTFVPTKAADETYVYTFSEWDAGVVDGNRKIYTPHFTCVEDPLLTVVWLDGDGSELERRTFRESQAEPFPTKTPVKEDDANTIYSFSGWDSGTVDGNTKTYAPIFDSYDIPTISYTVSFDSNGGTGTMDDVSGISGTYTLPDCTFTAPEGKTFDKWEIEGTLFSENDTITVSEYTAVKAIWRDSSASTYTVSFASNGGSGTMAYEIGISGTYTLPACGFTAPSGKTFQAWSVVIGDADPVTKAAGSTITVTADTTVSAVWESNADAVTILTASLTLEGQIGLNFRIRIPDSIKNADGAKAVFRYQSRTAQSILLSGVSANQNDEYIFTFRVPAKEIANKIGIQIVNGSGTPYTIQNAAGRVYDNGLFEYAVTDYCAVVPDSDADVKALTNALQNYGAYAWAYFQPSNVTQPVPATNVDMSDITLETLSSHIVKQTGGVDGLQLKTIFLVLESETTVKLRFETSDPLSAFTITGGNATTSENGFVVDIPDIPAKNLDAIRTVTVKKGSETLTVACSALSYPLSVLTHRQEGDDALVNVVKSLYLYNLAAKNYFNNH